MAFAALTLGIVCACFCVWFSIETALLLRRGVVTTGRVVALVPRRGRHSGFEPRIEFRDRNGAPHTFVASTTSYANGETVSVIFDPADLGRVQIDSFAELSKAPAALGFGALFFGWSAWYGLWRRRGVGSATPR